MRIAHVVNLLDPVGTYGGPLRVALNQVTELRAQGHEVDLVCGATGFVAGTSTERVCGGLVPLMHRSFNLGGRTGFVSRWSPGVHRWVLRSARSYDVVHVHLGRDLTTAPAAALLGLRGVPYVAQTHGMITPGRHPVVRIMDAVLIRRALVRAGRVLALTPREVPQLQQVVGHDLAVEVLHNGVPEQSVPEQSVPEQSVPERGMPERDRRAGSPSGAVADLPEVLFLSRLHARKRPRFFVTIAAALRARGVRARFTVVGPDEGELAGVQADIAAAADPEQLISYGGATGMQGSVARMSAADVFVMPSRAEPFSMVVAEAMSVGLPVVCSRSCGLADSVAQADAGIVVPDDDVDAWVEAVASLLADPESAAKRGRAGLELVSRELGISAVASRLGVIYAELATDPATA